MTMKYTETKTFDSDRPMTVLGVPGRLKARTVCSKTVVGCWEKQSWVSERRTATVDGEKVLMHAEIRFDDECHNGHNSFAITGHGWYDHFKARDWDFGGCCHEMIAEVFPELEPLIQWHLVSSDGPMHYIANTLYHASKRDLSAARATANWPEATDEQLCLPEPELKALLEERLPPLLAKFRADVEGAGFLWSPED